MGSSATVRKGHGVLLADKEISLAGTRFQTDSGGRQRKRIGLGSQGLVRFGDPYSQDDQIVGRLEELAIPLFDPFFNIARRLANTSNDAEDLVQDLSQGFTNFASSRSGTNFHAWMFRILKNTFLSSCSILDRRHDRRDSSQP